MVPTFCGNGVAASEPTLTLVSVTLLAGVPPVFDTVNCTTTLPPVRVSTFVTTRLIPDGGDGAAFTLIVVEAAAVA